ncbi:uncharacterized protein LOC129236932 [Anastrepha obliqua]|uniref:uncharacterized protein LOC129236932 n=1 Tax=Anastrepha obliqua TaxID=95512 RepID=UPI002409C33A|nr:uncharacterized protein LOC129236932 [Anastrepha obliqua]
MPWHSYQMDAEILRHLVKRRPPFASNDGIRRYFARNPIESLIVGRRVYLNQILKLDSLEILDGAELNTSIKYFILEAQHWVNKTKGFHRTKKTKAIKRSAWCKSKITTESKQSRLRSSEEI